MKAHWLRHEGVSEVLVIFGGWALGSAPFAGLNGAQDLLFVDDWRQIDENLAEIEDYARCDLLAFSFGVAAAGHWLAARQSGGGRDPFRRKVAVNGTRTPASETAGIPPDMIRATMSGLSEASLARFARRAGAEPPPAPKLTALQDELEAVLTRGPAPETRFDRIWLSTQDRIFPPAAMEAAWAGQSQALRKIKAPHAPFALWQGWAEVMA